MPVLPIESTEALVVFLLVFFRITGVLLSAPLFSNRGFPVPVRLWVGVLLALVMFPVIWGRSADGALLRLLESEVALVLAVGTELAIGWMIGWIASVMVLAMQLAGHIVGQEIGFAIGEVFDPISEGQSAITTQLFFTLGLVLFVILGGTQLVVDAANQSFTVLPPGGVVAAIGAGGALLDPEFLVVDTGNDLFRNGLRIALPGMVGLMLATGAMAILARSVPEMNVFILGFTIRILLGLFTVWMILPLVGEVFAAGMQVSVEMLDQLLLMWRG